MKRLRLFSISLFIIGSIFIICGAFELNSANNKYDRILGYWYEESGMLFKFENNVFYWYKDYNELSDNYYQGNLEIINLCDYHLNKQKIKDVYGNIDCHDYYELKLYPKKIISNKKVNYYNNNYYLKLAIYFEDIYHVHLYDFTKNKIYDIAKMLNF